MSAGAGPPAAGDAAAPPFRAIADAALAGERIDSESGLVLLREAKLDELCSLADELRRRRVPGDAVTFVIDTNPNYTNVCRTGCLFCAFHRPPGHAESYRLSAPVIVQKVRPAVEAGATTVLLQGGNDSAISLDYYLDVLRSLKAGFPDLCAHLWSPPEIETMAEAAGLSATEVLQHLWDNGQRTLPGGGAEILVDRVRQRISPAKQSAAGWLDVMRAAHRLGFRTTATMMYGHVETDAEIVEHLRLLRELQDEAGGFTAFIPWSFKPGNTALESEIPEGVGPVRYLRIIALARVMLDNFAHIQASWFSEGKEAGQIALSAGADDFGGTLLEENVLRLARHENRSTIEECVELIKGAGFRAVQRTTLYETVREW